MFKKHLEIGQVGELAGTRQRRTRPDMEHLDVRILPGGYSRGIYEPAPPRAGQTVLLASTTAQTPLGQTAAMPGDGSSPGRGVPRGGIQ
jgi:hypothetical protein